MSNIAELFSVDEPHPIEILHPQTGNKMGITINVVSPDSPRVVQAMRTLEVRRMRDNIARAGEDRDIEAEMAKFMIEQDDALISASIVSWDWGEMTWDHIHGAGDASAEDVAYFVNDPRATSIKRQVLWGVKHIANFTKTLPTDAPKKRKK